METLKRWTRRSVGGLGCRRGTEARTAEKRGWLHSSGANEQARLQGATCTLCIMEGRFVTQGIRGALINQGVYETGCALYDKS